MATLAVDLAGMHLSSPLVAASGTVGSVVDFTDSIDFSLYGAAVAKSVSPTAWPGRTPPRIAPIGDGMLNGIGIQNPGIDAWLSEVDPLVGAVPAAVWGSAVAHEVSGFATVAAKLDASSVSAIEVNLSCPNLDGKPFALDPKMSAEVVAAVRSVTTKPIGAKLSPDAMPVSAVAEAALEAGADWLTMGNTAMGAGIDVETRRPLTSGLISGYSGSPLRPIAVRCVIELARDIPGAPIVGCGGVSRGEHVIEYILAGATAVGIGSAHFAKPRVARTVLRDISRYMRRHRIASLEELRGAYRPWAS